MDTVNRWIQSLPPLWTPNNLKRGVTLFVSALIMATGGSLFTFSSFSEDLSRKFGYGSTDLNIISGVGNTALYLSFFACGPVYDRFGARVTMAMATVTCGIGYLLMWAAYVDRVSGSVAAMSTFYFFAGFGNCSGYMAALGESLYNTPKKYQGIVTGVLLVFYGLSATLYSQVYAGYYAAGPSGRPDTAGFLIFLCVSCVVLNGLGIFALFRVGTKEDAEDKKRLMEGAEGEIAKSVQVSAEVVDLQEPSSTHPLKDLGEKSASRDAEKGTSAHEKPAAPVTEAPGNDMTPMEMLKSVKFWLFALTFIWQQGITYFSNISMVVSAAYGGNANKQLVAQTVNLHVTVLSVCQALGRLVFGILKDIMGRYGIDGLYLLFFTDFLLIIPLCILGWSTGVTLSGVMVCSILIGIGFGAGGSVFATVTRELLGSTHYGTACAFVLGGVPIGILVSNMIFGALFDAESAAQGQINGICYGHACYSKAFLAFSLIQLIPIGTSLALLVMVNGAKWRSLRRSTVAP